MSERPPALGKVLVANRGEIAVRVIRACRELGIAAAAIYSEADREALHVRLADEAHPVGPPPATSSYLDVARVVGAAVAAGADALHPGYGFLSENPALAQACAEAGIRFVGPPAEVIRRMGDKLESRRAMAAAGVPIVPGTTEPLLDARAAEDAARVGYPLMVKASAGGGGRGLRRVAEPGELAAALARARSEAKSSFGDDTLYLERALEGPRHVEVQILADAHGHVLHLFERECSVQRRHQKLLEEAPSPSLPPDTRARLGATAVAAARAVGYVGAGTVEFLLDATGAFFFLEMNTRIQVEHAITEMVTGIDLVKAQLRVAAGEPLGLAQEDVRLRGHAIEARIYAEDPEKGFLPSPGRISVWRAPDGPGVRVDAGVEVGSAVPPHYDPMVAKLVVHGADRAEAIARLRRALAEFAVAGIHTSIPFHLRAVEDAEFRAGRYDTGFAERLLARPEPDDPLRRAVAAAVAALAAGGKAGDRFAVTEAGRTTTLALGGGAGAGFEWEGAPLELDAVGLANGIWSLRAGARCFEATVTPRPKGACDVRVGGRVHRIRLEPQ